jgi:hypothetical protein
MVSMLARRKGLDLGAVASTLAKRKGPDLGAIPPSPMLWLVLSPDKLRTPSEERALHNC